MNIWSEIPRFQVRFHPGVYDSLAAMTVYGNIEGAGSRVNQLQLCQIIIMPSWNQITAWTIDSCQGYDLTECSGPGLFFHCHNPDIKC